jgi:hypothetical protein
MVFQPKEGEFRNWRRTVRPVAAMPLTSKYKYLGVVPGRRIMAGTRKGACKDAVMQQSGRQTDCSWFRPSSIPLHVWRKDTTAHQRHVMVVKSFRSIQPCIPTPLTFCTDTGLLPPACFTMPLNCAGGTDARTWRLADGPRRRCDSGPRSRGVGRPKVARTRCGNVKSITEQISSTP